MWARLKAYNAKLNQQWERLPWLLQKLVLPALMIAGWRNLSDFTDEALYRQYGVSHALLRDLHRIIGVVGMVGIIWYVRWDSKREARPK